MRVKGLVWLGISTTQVDGLGHLLGDVLGGTLLFKDRDFRV